jgi:hypothetical protein
MNAGWLCLLDTLAFACGFDLTRPRLFGSYL